MTAQTAQAAEAATDPSPGIFTAVSDREKKRSLLLCWALNVISKAYRRAARAEKERARDKENWISRFPASRGSRQMAEGTFLLHLCGVEARKRHRVLLAPTPGELEHQDKFLFFPNSFGKRADFFLSPRLLSSCHHSSSSPHPFSHWMDDSVTSGRERLRYVALMLVSARRDITGSRAWVGGEMINFRHGHPTIFKRHVR